MNKIQKGVMLLLLLFLVGCTHSTNHIPEQGENHWLVLNRHDASEQADVLVWDFMLKRAGKYDVQILRHGDGANEPSEMKLSCAGTELSETPKNIFVLDKDGEKQTVWQFSKTVQFNEPGAYSLKVSKNESIVEVRILPHYRNNLGFGSGKYHEEWLAMHESPEKKAALTWFNEAKYGMFIHWGLYSESGGVWKGTRIEDSPFPGPRVAEWLMSTFQIPRKEYAELAKTFNPDASFAETIARLAKDAGMKYIVITSKHHDGFALFDSPCSDFDIVDATPYKGDAIKELYDACLKEGLKFGVYYSHGNDWHDGADGNYAKVKKRNDLLGVLTHKQGKNHWDPSPNTFEEYLENKAYPQIKELVQMMPELALIWFDGDGNITEDQSFRFYKEIYDMNPHVIVSRRVGYDFGDYLDAGDNVIPSADEKLTKQWETCGTTNNSWGYKSYDEDWKSSHEMLYYLVDIASKGGNYLLNIGPDGLGHVPKQSAEGLREIGQWLKVNGDAIYGTKRWEIQHEGQDEMLLKGTGHRAKAGFSRSFTNKDFWFTAKEGTVYAICLAQSEDGVHISSLNTSVGTIRGVRLLGTDQKLTWSQTDTELKVDFTNVSTSKNGFALEVSFN